MPVVLAIRMLRQDHHGDSQVSLIQMQVSLGQRGHNIRKQHEQKYPLNGFLLNLQQLKKRYYITQEGHEQEFESHSNTGTVLPNRTQNVPSKGRHPQLVFVTLIRVRDADILE